MRWLVVLLALLFFGTACGAETHRNALRVTLTAENHHPRASHSPSVQWWYCVKVRTATGTSVASRIRLQILRDGSVVRPAGTVWLNKGYHRWCASIGGEASLLNVVPRHMGLIFQAVVTADGTTVERNWPIVVR